ncbi:bacteriohemerythrin [Thioalbus denitrificans]|uniref:Hemerythrin n=1 Tax=Thioalbus denitrificans TaxID=547122 RepID=A0A369CHD2_9GAMM|nr:bacteriohemerythrin [Thioalbus denitrificans]RCX33329.1 hemerythrin [Thioalbus denitrificans]
MSKTLSMFGLAILILALIVLTAIGFLSGPASPLAWTALLLLAAIPFIHRLLVKRRFVSWHESYSVGVAALDADHKKLLRLINNLQTAIHYQTGEEFIHEALDELVDYTRTHFGREEALMRDNGYPDLEAHQREHRDMIDKVNGMVTRYHAEGEEALEPLARFLKEWLLNHINGTDQRYGPFLNGKGVR